MNETTVNTVEEGQHVKIVVDHRYANTVDLSQPVKIVVDHRYANTVE